MIRSFDYLPQFKPLEAQIMDAVSRVLNSNKLLLGPETEAFEQEFADFLGVKHCIGVTSGTTALHLALMSLGVTHGDEVISVANTCVPTIAAIELTGATPVLVDVNEHDLMINPRLVEQAITERTKCILPVHLWGQSVDMSALLAISQSTGIPILEDCAQAQGAMIHGKHVGTIGNAGAFSFYPTKNLGSYGDAGAVVTDDDELARLVRLKRMYGYTKPNFAEVAGFNARMAEIQAAILRVKLPYLEGWLARRQENADLYLRGIHSSSIRLPRVQSDRVHAFHQFVIECESRNAVVEALEKNEIQHAIHYATPIHKMPAYAHLKVSSLAVTERSVSRILSIPVHESLTDDQVDFVVSVLNGI